MIDYEISSTKFGHSSHSSEPRSLFSMSSRQSEILIVLRVQLQDAEFLRKDVRSWSRQYFPMKTSFKKSTAEDVLCLDENDLQIVLSVSGRSKKMGSTGDGLLPG